MDKEDPVYGNFRTLFVEMSEALLAIQQADGFWRTSLFDPEHITKPETSGTAFFCFGFLWGVANNVLPADRFMEPAFRAWKACVGKIEDGVLLCSQQDSNGPTSPKCDCCPTDYATGALLLAGEQLVKLHDQQVGINMRMPTPAISKNTTTSTIVNLSTMNAAPQGARCLLNGRMLDNRISDPVAKMSSVNVPLNE
jgi:hypothetical protein